MLILTEHKNTLLPPLCLLSSLSGVSSSLLLHPSDRNPTSFCPRLPSISSQFINKNASKNSLNMAANVAFEGGKKHPSDFQIHFSAHSSLKDLSS